MKSRNCLGIYISRNRATVVCLDLQDSGENVLGHFSVSVENQEQHDMQALVGLIVEGCREKGWKFSEVTIALDCAMVMQHSVHSEFNDPRQIRATIRFDTEEALATDISEVGLAFEVTSTDETGSELTVFTAQKNILSEILIALQRYNLDPVIMEPDVNCLSRFIRRKINSGQSGQTGILYGLLSQRNGYLIMPPGADADSKQKSSVVRTFLVGSGQDKSQLLTREILVTTGLVENISRVNSLKIFDFAGTVDSRQLGERLGIAGEEIDLSGIAGFVAPDVSDNANPVDFTIAYGAALAGSEKAVHIANFRDDFNPYQGKKIRMQKALKFAATSVAVLLLAAGLYFQMQLFNVNRDRNNLRSKFSKDYFAVTLDKLEDDVTIREAVRKLGGIYRRVELEKKGIVTDDNRSIASKLTLVLAALNKCAAKTDLNINTITITSRDINIVGDTSGRSNTMALFEEIRNSGLEIPQPNYELRGNRDNFSISLTVAKKDN